MLDQYFKDEAHNNLLYRYAIEGVSFACKWAYRGATPGSFLSGTNISFTLLLLSLLSECVSVLLQSQALLYASSILFLLSAKELEELHSNISTTKWLQFYSAS